ncbi:MAG: DNA repair protein RecO [Clostridia bacterium]|nr:DNA repair protein RecO [Clostridia bacterium]MCL6522178.1 DNA repair protein RecO [Bacillota bacterium]
MPSYKTEALVLRTAAMGESDRRVDLLSPELGAVRVVARGARKVPSRLGGVLQPFARVRLLLWRGRTLDGVSQAETIRSFHELRERLEAFAFASAAAEAALALARPDGEAPRRYRLLLYTFERLAGGGPGEPALAYYLAQLLRIEGFAPDWSTCARCGRPIGGERRLAVAEGGVLCADCGLRSGEGEPLPEAVAHLAEALARLGPRGAEALGPDPALAMAAARALARLLAAAVDRSMKSLELLDIIRHDAEGSANHGG